MQIKIDIPLNEEEIRKDILERCRNESQRALSNQIDKLFRAPGEYGATEGTLHLVVRNRIENYLLSDQFNAQLDRWIQERIGTVLDEAGRKLMSWAVRKKLFTALDKGLKMDAA